jgi:hypothetical protein
MRAIVQTLGIPRNRSSCILVMAILAATILAACTSNKRAVRDCLDLYIFSGDMVLAGNGLARLGSTFTTYVKNSLTNQIAWQDATAGQARYRNGKQIDIEDVGALEVRVTLQAPAQLIPFSDTATTLNDSGHFYWPLVKWRTADKIIEFYSEDTPAFQIQHPEHLEDKRASAIFDLSFNASIHYLLVRVLGNGGAVCQSRIACYADSDHFLITKAAQ